MPKYICLLEGELCLPYFNQSSIQHVYAASAYCLGLKENDTSDFADILFVDCLSLAQSEVCVDSCP